MLFLLLFLPLLIAAGDDDVPKLRYHNVQLTADATKFLRHLVVFKDVPSSSLMETLGTKLEQFADHFHFTTGNFSRDALDLLNRTGIVEFIEPDYPVSAALPGNITTLVQNTPGWGLDRMDQRNLPLDKSFKYPASAGAGVNVYIVDTGVDVSNPEFEDRATFGYNSLQGSSAQTDDNGHGSFAAALIAGRTFGVAKKANIIAVKSLGPDGSALVSDVLRGLNWVVRQHLSSDNKKTVINLSLGSPFSRSTNNAVANAVNQGITVVVAAGNGDDNGVAQDACEFSPSSSSSVITVGASMSNDQVAPFSNYGTCVTILAPGVKVTSIGDGGEAGNLSGPVTGFSQQSGTSFSSPYVAGVVALMLGEGGVIHPAEVKNRLTSAASRGVLTQATRSTPNLLINEAEVSLGPGTSVAPHVRPTLTNIAIAVSVAVTILGARL